MDFNYRHCLFIKLFLHRAVNFFSQQVTKMNMNELQLQYWAKVMKTIINEILFGTKYCVIFWDIYCSSCCEILPSCVRYFVTSKRNFIATQ